MLKVEILDNSFKYCLQVSASLARLIEKVRQMYEYLHLHLIAIDLLFIKM